MREVVAMMEHGLYMICNVKGCHMFFPKARLKENTPAFRTNTTCTTLALHTKALCNSGKQMDLYACGWRATTKMVVTYLSSCSMTVPGEGRKKNRY